MFSEEKKERIREKTKKLLKEDWSYLQIARLFGLTEDFVKELVPPEKKAKSRVRSKPKKY